jgi:hypothetical protein
MKIYLPMLLSMLLAGILCAAAAGENDTDAAQPEVQQQQPADSSTSQRSAPAPSFTPSEKVGADSAVSFPVDI